MDIWESGLPAWAPIFCPDKFHIRSLDRPVAQLVRWMIRHRYAFTGAGLLAFKTPSPNRPDCRTAWCQKRKDGCYKK